MLAAWTAGQAPDWNGIDWDAPVFTWQSTKGGQRQGALVHPLAYAFQAGGPTFGLAVLQARIAHPWPPGVVMQAQGTDRLPLPSMDNLWGWGVFEEVLRARAWEGLDPLVAHLARNLGQSPHGATTHAGLAGKLGRADLKDPAEIRRLLDRLAPLMSDPGQAALVEGLALQDACKHASPESVLAWATVCPHAVVLDHVRTMVERGAWPEACTLMACIPPADLTSWGSAGSAGVAFDTTMANLLSLVLAPFRPSNSLSSEHPSAVPARALLGAMFLRIRVPFDQLSSLPFHSQGLLASALAQAPEAFPDAPALRADPPADLLWQWLDSGEEFRAFPRACFQARLVLGGLPEEWWGDATRLSVRGLAGPEDLGELCGRLERWADELGADFRQLAAAVTPLLPTSGMEEDWGAFVARRSATRLDAALGPVPDSVRRPRM